MILILVFIIPSRSSQTYDDFTVGNNNASSSGGPLESSKSGPKPSSDDKDVNTDQSDIEF